MAGSQAGKVFGVANMTMSTMAGTEEHGEASKLTVIRGNGSENLHKDGREPGGGESSVRVGKKEWRVQARNLESKSGSTTVYIQELERII